MKWLLRHGIYIPIFTVWKYLVGGIYQRGDLKLKSAPFSPVCRSSAPLSPPSECRIPLRGYFPLSVGSVCRSPSVQFYLPLSVQDPPLWVVPPLTPLCRSLSLCRSIYPPLCAGSPSVGSSCSLLSVQVPLSLSTPPFCAGSPVEGTPPLPLVCRYLSLPPTLCRSPPPPPPWIVPPPPL